MGGIRVCVALLSYYSLFMSVDCFLSVSGDCSLSGLSFGGRLLMPSQDGAPPPWARRKMFVFRTNRRGQGSLGRSNGGRGRIWVTSSQTCGGANNEPSASSLQHCPAEEEFPCMDTSVPCKFDPDPPPAPCYSDPHPLVFVDPSPAGGIIRRPEWDETAGCGEGLVTSWELQYRSSAESWNTTLWGEDRSHLLNLQPGTTFAVRIALRNLEGELGAFSDWQNFTTPCGGLSESTLTLSTTSRRPGLAKVIANWRYRTLCSITKRTIRFQQLDRDGCSPEESGNLDDVSKEPVGDAETLRSLNANSLFNVTVILTTTTNETLSFSQLIRNNVTAPTGIPIVLEPLRRRGSRMIFSWDALSCGQRNSESIKYLYSLVSDSGREWSGSRDQQRVVIPSVPSGEGYTFKVKAVSPYGHGEDSEEKRGTF